MKIKKEVYENKPKDIKNNVSQFLIFKKSHIYQAF